MEQYFYNFNKALNIFITVMLISGPKGPQVAVR